MNEPADIIQQLISQLQSDEVSDQFALIKKLRSDQVDQEFDKRLGEFFNSKYNKLDDLVCSLDGLAKWEIRKDIENEQRKGAIRDAWLDSAWTNTPVTDQNDSKDAKKKKEETRNNKKQTIKLICVVEIIHTLIFRQGVALESFTELFKLKPDVVFGLAKLICAFTSDFKLLVVVAPVSKGLRDDMVKYLNDLEKKDHKFTEQEKTEFEKVLWSVILDGNHLEDYVTIVFDHFRGNKSTFKVSEENKVQVIGYRNKEFGSLMLINRVYGNREQITGERRVAVDQSLSKLTQIVDGLPFLLTAIRNLLKSYTEYTRVHTDSNENGLNNTVLFLTLLLTIVEHNAASTNSFVSDFSKSVAYFKKEDFFKLFLRRLELKSSTSHDHFRRLLDGEPITCEVSF